MKRLLSILSLLLVAVAVSGCGGGSSQGATGPTLAIQTYADPSGISQPWVDAAVSGYTLDAGCSTTASCKISFGNGTQRLTNTSGLYSFSTSALPATWYLAAVNGPNTQTCQTEATGAFALGTEGPTADLICGSVYGAAAVIATPNSCVATYSYATGQVIHSTCPTNVTINAVSTQFPVSRALTASLYDEAETLLSSSSVTATSSTTVSVPTPTSDGVTLMNIIDPTTNLPLGAALFTRTTVVQSPSCGYKRSCNPT